MILISRIKVFNSRNKHHSKNLWHTQVQMWVWCIVATSSLFITTSQHTRIYSFTDVGLNLVQQITCHLFSSLPPSVYSPNLFLQPFHLSIPMWL